MTDRSGIIDKIVIHVKFVNVTREMSFPALLRTHLPRTRHRRQFTYLLYSRAIDNSNEGKVRT